MVGAAAWADILRDARAGTMRRAHRVRRRPRIVFARFEPHPAVGEPTRLVIASRYAAGAQLCVQQMDGTILFEGPVPPNCELTVTPTTPAVIRVLLTFEPMWVSAPVAPPATHDFQVTPHVPLPQLSVSIPSRVPAGEPLTITWEAPTARSVRLYIDYGDRREEFLEAPGGIRVIRPTRLGPISVRLIAEGAFAHKTVLRTVQVFVPKVEIVIDRQIRSGAPGAEIACSWHIKNAQRAYFDAPARNERHEVSFSETAFITIGATTEEFVLTAIGFDGRAHTKPISIIPRLIAHFDDQPG